MTWALWGVALVSCKVVLWLAEHIGWGGTQYHPCSVGQLGSSEWQSSILPLRWIYADPHHYWSASIVINLPNSVLNEVFSEPKTDTFSAIAESNGEAGDLSVKGIMDHYIAWSRAYGMDTTPHRCSSLPESREFWLHAAFFGPNKICATSPGSNVKSINIKM